MSSSKKQQSFSSYSQDKNDTQKVYQEEEGFSEYEEQPVTQDKIQVPRQKVHKDIPQQRRRYSYGKIDEKSSVYNYLDVFNDVSNARGTYYTASLKHPRQSKFIMGAGSPCGIGAFESTSLMEYEKCYLSGLNKYYKSHNYNKKPQTRHSASSSVNQNKSIERPLNRSQYWNGQKFDYFKEKQPNFIDKRQNPNILNETKNNKKVNFQRNLTSGLIVNKKQLKETKAAVKPVKSKQDTSTYIKIEEYPSNTKKISQIKKPSLQKAVEENKKDRQALMQRQLKQNTNVAVSNKKPSETQFQSIQLKQKDSILMQKQYSTLLAQKKQLALQNSRLKQILKNKDLEIQKLAKMRIVDNDEYSQTIEKLKQVFETQRNEMIREFESQINVYKSVRKQAIKNQLVKQQAEKITLITQKNKIESQLKRVNTQLNHLNEELNQKNIKIKTYQQKISFLQTQIDSNNQNRIQPRKSSLENQKQSTKNKTKNQESLKIKQSTPEWIRNFLNVFKNMVIKLIGEVDPNWSEKKIIIIGWKVVKIIIQKAVKIGIKVPQIVNDDQVGQCSLISYPQKSTGDTKKYNFNASKKPIRV